ncbi:MAG: glucose 1-dehydrogenase [Candidatus Rokubacteria bacterium]|nr:glucose 1-dehydrogenase [Candidatus Rokubacteria bacterium]
MARRFEDKVVVITGAGGGIGRAAAVRFASEGARVVLVDVSASALGESLTAVEQAGGQALAVEADVTQAPAVEGYVQRARERFGGIDCFFNNAGILGAVSPLVDYPEETFDRVMAINVKSVWLGLRAVAPVMIARGGGAIVNTASIAGLRGTPNLVAYTASKHAVIGLTRTASLEFSRHGIRVNAVCPSPVETAMARLLEDGFGPKDPLAARERLTATIPMRRYAKPEEVAALVAFLCSADASYINGAIYTVDGGAMA